MKRASSWGHIKPSRWGQFWLTNPIVAEDIPILPLYVPKRVAFYNKTVFDNWYYTPGCSPCRGTRNKHMYVTGKTTGF